MKCAFLHEPELEFGRGERHCDVRYGMMNFGPADVGTGSAPNPVRIGLVGTGETIDGVMSWLGKCSLGIPAKESRQPNLFPAFPGFTGESPFQSQLVVEDRWKRSIPQRLLRSQSNGLPAGTATSMADLLLEEVSYLCEDTPVDVVVVAVPREVLDIDLGLEDGKDSDDDGPQGGDAPVDFHHYLKARAMRLRAPTQLITPFTWSSERPKKYVSKWEKPLQDEATRAWNFFTALYYKAKGVPWRLPRSAADFDTCHVGISFYWNLKSDALLTSMAQVFNERGEGVVVRGGTAQLDKQDDQVHLDRKDARSLLETALTSYRQEHRHLPARVVVHKSSIFNAAEIDGMNAAAEGAGIDMIDLLSIGSTGMRLFRTRQYPPLRGTVLHLTGDEFLLYTKGSVGFYQTYPGMYIPSPLHVRLAAVESSAESLAKELLTLTKMNWNNTQFDGRLPVTLKASRHVKDILKYVPEHGYVAPSYRYYM